MPESIYIDQKVPSTHALMYYFESQPTFADQTLSSWHLLIHCKQLKPKNKREICSKLTIKTPERRHCGDFILFFTLNNFTLCSGILEIEKVNAGWVLA